MSGLALSHVSPSSSPDFLCHSFLSRNMGTAVGTSPAIVRINWNGACKSALRSAWWVSGPQRWTVPITTTLGSPSQQPNKVGSIDSILQMSKPKLGEPPSRWANVNDSMLSPLIKTDVDNTDNWFWLSLTHLETLRLQRFKEWLPWRFSLTRAPVTKPLVPFLKARPSNGQ